MKISQAEIDAAKDADTRLSTVDAVCILNAALKVRRDRKQAKRERQRKEKDKQVVESVKPEYYQSSYGFGAVTGGPLNSLFPEIIPSKAPEWDGEFSIGEYQMRNGDKATVTTITGNTPYPLIGWIDGAPYHWHSRGFTAAEPDYDLIRPWPKGEQ